MRHDHPRDCKPCFYGDEQAVLDYMDCIDNPPGHGATIWWEDSAK